MKIVVGNIKELPFVEGADYPTPYEFPFSYATSMYAYMSEKKVQEVYLYLVEKERDYENFRQIVFAISGVVDSCIKYKSRLNLKVSLLSPALRNFVDDYVKHFRSALGESYYSWW